VDGAHSRSPGLWGSLLALSRRCCSACSGSGCSSWCGAPRNGMGRRRWLRSGSRCGLIGGGESSDMRNNPCWRGAVALKRANHRPARGPSCDLSDSLKALRPRRGVTRAEAAADPRRTKLRPWPRCGPVRRSRRRRPVPARPRRSTPLPLNALAVPRRAPHPSVAFCSTGLLVPPRSAKFPPVNS